MKVLIVAVNKEKYPDPVFPLGASYIAHSAKLAGHEVIIFDACFEPDVDEKLKNIILENKPEIIAVSIRNVDNVCFSASENYLPDYKTIINICKKNSTAKIVMGGSGFSILPELYMEELKPDYGIKGEGEYAFIELLKNISENNVSEQKLIHSNRIKDINFDTFPKREGFDMDTYYKYSGCINIQTKRGCGFKCSYCTYPLLEGHSYRFRTSTKVVDEIEYWLQSKGINSIFFVDNVFNHPENYAQKICEEIIKRNLKITWTGFFIPKIENPEFLDICKESGLTGIDFGTDAFSNNTLKGFDKHFTVDDIFRSCELCKEKNIKFNHSIIFGGPNETKLTLEETVSNLDKTNPTSLIGFIGIRLYPNTPFVKSINDLDIGLNPTFYISEDIKDIIIDYLQNVIKTRKNWVIPGLIKESKERHFKRMRQKGIKGPLWEFLEK